MAAHALPPAEAGALQGRAVRSVRLSAKRVLLLLQASAQGSRYLSGGFGAGLTRRFNASTARARASACSCSSSASGLEIRAGAGNGLSGCAGVTPSFNRRVRYPATRLCSAARISDAVVGGGVGKDSGETVPRIMLGRGPGSTGGGGGGSAGAGFTGPTGGGFAGPTGGGFAGPTGGGLAGPTGGFSGPTGGGLVLVQLAAASPVRRAVAYPFRPPLRPRRRRDPHGRVRRPFPRCTARPSPVSSVWTRRRTSRRRSTFSHPDGRHR